MFLNLSLNNHISYAILIFVINKSQEKKKNGRSDTFRTLETWKSNLGSNKASFRGWTSEWEDICPSTKASGNRLWHAEPSRHFDQNATHFFMHDRWRVFGLFIPSYLRGKQPRKVHIQTSEKLSKFQEDKVSTKYHGQKSIYFTDSLIIVYI